MKPGSKNRRRNTSILIRYEHPTIGQKNILVDVGKFFWHSAIEWFPKYQVPGIDAIVISHAHYDAIGGLDDLRDWTNNVQEAIPIFLRQRDLDNIAKTHFYLVDESLQTGGGGIAKLRFDLIDEEPFDVQGLKFTPLPVEHGERMIALGFRVGNFSYVSDASHIPESTTKLIEGSDILVLDALRPSPHRSHFSTEQAIEQVRRFRPRKAYFVDMTHDNDHEKTNAELAKLKASEGLDIELAYDGMRVEMVL